VEENERIEIPLLHIPREVEVKQRERVAKVRASRDDGSVEAALGALKESAVDGTNLMPRLLECTRRYATLGEMCTALAEVFGVYEEPAVF
jgi:methylmalonyl-CoA mutase N-terminal domain/subunit